MRVSDRRCVLLLGPFPVRWGAYRYAVLITATFLGLKITNAMTAGDALVAGGTFLLALFGAMSAFEALAAIRAGRGIDEMDVRRREYRRSREVRGVARLIHHEVVINRDVAEDALHEGHWTVSSATTHHAWDVSAALIMEEVDEDTAAKLVAFFSEVVRWETFVGRVARTTPQVESVPVNAGGVPFEVAQRLTELARDCMSTLRRLAYPDAREVPSDPDVERAYTESQKRRRWYFLWLHKS